MTGLLVELHRTGLFWGDCSLANTLLMRDGQRLQAYLVDAETSEIHEQLSDGQREADLEIAIENVAGDLADLAVMGAAPSTRSTRTSRRRSACATATRASGRCSTPTSASSVTSATASTAA